MKLKIFKAALFFMALFISNTAFSQQVRSLVPEKKKEAAYTEQKQAQITNGEKPVKKEKAAGTSVLSSATSKGENKVATATSPNYYNPRSIIYNDPRTPRYPLTGDKAADIANYNKAKQVWMQNNPQTKTAVEMTDEQKKERNEKGK